jgi:exopolyphosphatase/guanosine-5'-triphosphate,3'-diphosphate pyrophosphatase
MTDAAPGPLTVAAVDLGSNSFHMVIARYVEHDLHILDRLREPVRLADALQQGDVIRGEVADRAVACLERFGQRLRGIPAPQVRAVGTNTLRRAKNRRSFAREVQRALGHPVAVISGQEEARLIYLGISHTNPMEGVRRLAVDIGGGSTEVIVGEGFDVLRSHSLFMGCVRFSRDFFPGGVITREGFRVAETAAALELRAVRERLRALGWDSAVGSSGTILAVSDLLKANDQGGPEVTLVGLKKLRRALVDAGHVDRLDALPGMRADRAPVLPGGLAILIALFRSLDIQSMSPSTGALREGVLYDLVGRIEHRDVRDRTIHRIVDQYHIDLAQAGRVENTALGLLAQVAAAWNSERSWEMSGARDLLIWASLLHEIGLTVSYTGYHKHGEYLVRHMDLPGFSEDDQRTLAALIRGHRRRLSPLIFESVPSDDSELARRLCVLLRLAVLLNRSRVPESAIVPEIQWRNGALRLTFPHQWLENHPLTRADLEQETAYLGDLDTKLEVRETVSA